MAKIKYILDTRRPLANQTYPLKLQIYLNPKNRINIGMGISLARDQWMGDMVVRHPRKDAINSILRFRYNKAENELFRLEALGELGTINKKQLERLLSEGFDTSDTDPKDHSVRAIFEDFASTCKSPRTKSIYLQTSAKIGQMHGAGLLMTDINPAWVRQWECDMLAAGLAINSISVHLRNLRAVFNRAIDDDILPQNSYPFRKIKIKTERTAKRSLSTDQLRELQHHPCEPHQTQYRDYFMLIFYLMGINLVDLAALGEIREGRIEYRRSKTGRLYSIKVEPEALAIIEKYRGKGQLLNIGDHYIDYRDFLSRMNRNLKQIGTLTWVYNAAKDPLHVKRNKKHYAPLFPELSTYWARHTWATIAAGLDIPKETIAAALGHGGNSVTDIYIDFDQAKIDAANRRVIDWLNSK